MQPAARLQWGDCASQAIVLLMIFSMLLKLWTTPPMSRPTDRHLPVHILHGFVPRGA
jgi:hypothetical protein